MYDMIRYDNYQFLYQLLHGYLGKSCTRRLDLSYCEIFKIRDTDLQFGSPGYGWQKKTKGRRRTQAIANRFVFYANAKRMEYSVLNCVVNANE